jgi:hypothetical protein
MENETELGSAGGSGGGGSGGLFCGFRGGGGFAAALGLGRHGGSFADQFSGHDAGDEELGAVIVKIDRRTFLIGRSDNSESVHLMLDGLAFLHYLHRILLQISCFEYSGFGVFWPLARRSHFLKLQKLLSRKNRLEARNVFSLQAFWTLLDFELDGLTFIEGLVAFHRDGGKVNENIFSGLTLDEAEAL